MAEKPILFSGPMVRAILDGRKTQTRRIIKPQPVFDGCVWWYGDKSFIGDEAMQDHLFHEVYGTHGTPYGSMYESGGDRMWVRETWGHPGDYDGNVLLGNRKALYRADDDQLIPSRWRPSIHMPRSLSRITLEITNVRVERLQAISAKDIIAEGVVERPHVDQFGKNPVSAFDGCVYMDLLSLWLAGWESINGNGSWLMNPWLWVIEFKPVQTATAERDR